MSALCDLYLQEEAMAALNAMKDKSEKQTFDLSESKRQCDTLQQQLAQVQQMVRLFF